MKKLILLTLIVIGFQTAKSQSLHQRLVTATKDTIRTQIRMAILDYAEMQVDTATKKNERLCKDLMVELGGGWFTNIFAFMYAVKENDTVPTDGKVRNFVVTVWGRVAELNTRR